MNAITQAILNKSKLVVDLIKITKATQDSFLMSINGKITKIGITTAHISAMTVDLVGPKGTFGRLDIPPAKIGPSGGDITIIDQVVKIADMEAFKAFVRAIMQDEDLVLRLDNGEATIKALGRTSSIVYKKDIHLKGLKGLKTTVTETKSDGDGFESSILMVNPSPFEIDLGTVLYDVKDENGTVIAEQKGATYVKRGESSSKVTGPITGTASKSQVRFVGADVEENNWFKQIISAVDIWVAVPSDSKIWRAL
ncbi:hypothetical protein QQS21_000106 [Conoideocrella luteorostrata]|uniref:Uncharacterized protein n=1 Tax=Conoideocrella luteorostrata TaxID=1105319 RepID=A0AAJ0FZL2_9HYPO|nr:hypothetical protein QQS21_000106 [Conoideocrella luteorostrata]